MGKPPTRRTWGQRLALGAVVAGAVACFVAAIALGAGQWVVSRRQLVELADSSIDARGGATQVVMPGDSTTTPASTTTTTLPLVEPDAANFLIVGADNGDCSDDGAPTVGDRQDLGERSDTIMIWRLNPETDQLAVLSLPRDLYVKIPPGNNKKRINAAYRRDDPNLLQDTIFLNFGIPIDHYIQVDFCAFRRLVDAVGGVAVPFELPARDPHSGLDVPDTGCVELDGIAALAYVRSRYYEYEDPPGSGDWHRDGTSDFGRIARQQDFLRRVVAKVVGEGLYSPSVFNALYQTNKDYVVVDTGLTPGRMLEFANTLRTINAADITTYRIDSYGQRINGQSLQIPDLDGENMQAILAVFRGQATLASAPDQVLGTTDPSAATTPTDPPAGTGTSPDAASTDPGSTDPGSTDPGTTLPVVAPSENNTGVSPDPAVAC